MFIININNASNTNANTDDDDNNNNNLWINMYICPKKPKLSWAMLAGAQTVDWGK